MSAQDIYWCFFEGFFTSAPLVLLVGVFLTLKNALNASADFDGSNE